MLGTIAALAAAAAAGGSPAQAPPGSVFDYDASAPLAPTRELAAEISGGRIDKVTYLGTDGERVPALVMRPNGARGRTPCVVAGHWLTGSKDEVLAEKADEYAARGVTLFAIDARYHGERQGAVGPLDSVERLDTLYDLFRLTVLDMRRGLDYLDSRGLCDPARTGYEGRSMGGFTGSMLIGADRRIKAAVLLVSGANWRTYLSRSWVTLGGNLRGKRLDTAVKKLAPIDPKRWIPRARGRAVFMAAGRKDDATPFASARALHRAAREPKQVIVYNGGHDIEEPHGTRVYKAARAFLKKHLRLRR